jgi:hypothetical protein
MPAFAVTLYFLGNYQGETMGSEKNTFVKSLKRLIFSIIVTLLFCRGVTFCQVGDEFEGLYYHTEPGFARADLAEGLTPEILQKHQQALKYPLANIAPDTPSSVPIPPASVTAAVFIAAMVVGWLRRRTPS